MRFSATNANGDTRDMMVDDAFCAFGRSGFSRGPKKKTGYPGYPDIWETKPAGYPGYPDIWDISGEDVSILSGAH